MAGMSNQIIRHCVSKYIGFSNHYCLRRIVNPLCYQSAWAGSSHDETAQLSSNEPSYNQRTNNRTNNKGEHNIGRTLDTDDSDGEQINRTLFKENERTSSKRVRSSSHKKMRKVDKEWFKGEQDKIQASGRKDGDAVVKKHVKEPELREFDYEGDHSTVFKPIQRDKGEQELLMIQRPEQPENPHILKVAIIGTPNVGKSTLINNLLGRRIFPVSEKVHTTRSKAFAVINQDNKQIIVLDTPGVVDNKTGRRHNLARSLLLDFKNSILEADLVAVLVDASQHKTKDGLHFDVLKQLSQHPQLKSILIVNKIDMIKPRHQVLGITARLTSGKLGGKSYEISSKTAAKIGSLDKWSFFKATFKPPVANKMDGNDNKDNLQASTQMNGDPVVSGDSSVNYSNHDSEFESRTADSILSGVEQSKGDDNQDAFESSTSEGSVEETDSSDLNQNSVEETFISNQHVNDSIQELDAPDEGIRIEPNSVESVSDIDGCQYQDSQSTDNEKQAVQLSKVDIMQDYLSNLQEVSKINNEDPESFEAAKEMQRKKREEETEFNKKVAAMDGGWGGFDAAFVVSAKYGEGVRELKQYLLDQSTPRDWEYHDDVITSLTPQEIVKDAIREQLLKYLPEEVPYIVQQRNVFWGEGENGELRIMQDIVCTRKSQARMVQNKIGLIARPARQQIMNAFHCEVQLMLGVVIEKHQR